MTHTLRAAAAVATLALALTACGSGSEAPPASPATPAPTATAPASPASPAGRVSANDASEEELVAALEAAGVDNADRWAEEIEEYRPYPVDDPSLSGLRTELEKYNPDPATLDAILSVLTP